MGGYGVYQAYRRLVREEKTDHAADYLIFYIWGDDHIRSLLRCRHAIIYPVWDDQGGRMFHNNFWPNLEMDLETGRFVERENLLPTADSLRHMTEPQWMVDHLKDDLALELLAYKLGFIRELDRPASTGWLPVELPDGLEPADPPEQAGSFWTDTHSGQRGTSWTNSASLPGKNGRNSSWSCSIPIEPWRKSGKAETRYDQEIVDYLAREKTHAST